MIAIAPGVVDTAMQSQIRQTRQDDFRDVDRFMKLHEQGKLASPDAVAERLIEFFHQDDLIHGGIYDIRHSSSGVKPQ
jgi:benzil reductase ((S)-benzoin forming)